MARTRQKAKQRKAKRLEQERKAAERAGGGSVERTNAEAGGAAEAIAEIEEAQVRAAQELEEAQEVEVGAGAEAARHAAAAELATAAELETTRQLPEEAPSEDVVPAKPSRRERRRAQAALEEKEKEKAKPARVQRRREPKPAAKPKPAPKAPRSRGRVITFLKQVWAELRRVQWPNRTQVTQATAVVIVFCFIAGGYLAIWDFFFDKLIKAII
jgi:preprotein translocase SecE subunit